MKNDSPRRGWQSLLILLIAIPSLVSSVRALDLNNDGMDDIWQQRYGIGPFQGHGDPDGDA